MRIDPAHIRKIAAAMSKSADGGAQVCLDIAFMRDCMRRLSLWERGLMMQALLRASTSKRRTIEQRVLLALFVHSEGDQ